MCIVGTSLSRAPHEGVAETPSLQVLEPPTPPCVLPPLPLLAPPSPPSLGPLGLFCSADQGKLCLAIVFPKKFPLWGLWVTQSPESLGG